MSRPVAALILAAGLSSRMGRLKPVMDFAGRTPLDRVADLFRRAGVTDVRVVVGHRREELAPDLDRLGLPAVVNERYQEGMFSSIQAGAADLALSLNRGQRLEAFFLLPVDIPLVRPATIRRLLSAWSAQADARSVLVPHFLDEPGHPPLLGVGRISDILAWAGPGGLRDCLAAGGAAGVQPVTVTDEGILPDLDEPTDCRRLVGRAARLDETSGPDVPTPRECLAMLRLRQADPARTAHSVLTARLALRLGAALNEAGAALDLDLLVAAALLHDIARDEPRHGQAGARLLREWDFPAVAEAVIDHSDFEAPATAPVSEAELVFLVDKYAAGATLVSLADRFGRKARAFADNPAAQAGVTRRLAKARQAEARVTQAAGLSPETLFRSPAPLPAPAQAMAEAVDAAFAGVG